MGWKESLRSASFKNISFFISGSELQCGRKTVIHSFPDKDNPNYIEDLGKATRIYTMEAFILGDDYLIRRDALIRKFESKSIGTLIHPYYGRKKVKLVELARVSETTSEGGMARMSLTFSEAEKISFPNIFLNTLNNLFNQINDTLELVNNTFEDIYDVINSPLTLIEESIAILNDTILTIESVKKLSELGKSYKNALNNISDIITFKTLSPRNISGNIQSLFNLSSEELTNIPDTINQSTNTEENVELKTIEDNLNFLDNRIDSNSLDSNSIALNKYIKQIVLISCVNSSRLVKYASVQEANRTQNKILEKLNENLYNETDEKLAYSLASLKSSFIEDIKTRGVNLPSEINIQLPQVIDVLTLSYKLYNNLSQTEDIITRNNILHPGFIPVTKELQVLNG